MGGDRTRPMWVFVILLLSRPSRAMCPARCRCNDEALQTSCIGAGLSVVPIQLNPEMRFIDLSHNKIDKVHFTLSFYHNLISLDLSANKIQTLRTVNFDSQRNLKYLNLSSNEVESLAKESFKGLKNVTELDLSFNRLEELPAVAFRDLHSLEILKITNNQLVFLEEGLFTQTHQLRELLLDDNQLLEIPTLAIGDAPNLQILSLSRNLLASIEDGEMPSLPNLKILVLDTNVINSIHPGALAGLASLEYLNLSDNNFTAVPTTSLAKLSNLNKLYFGGNFVRSIPPVAFRGLFQLKYLRLDKLDLLTRIDPRAFVDNINLEKIWLDDNIELFNLPTRLFYGNPHISHISIRNNRLQTLEVSHFPLDQLKSLKLGGNPLQCNCSLLWLWRLEKEQLAKQNTGNETIDSTDFTIDVEHVRCYGPEPLANVLLADATESQVSCSLGWMAVTSAALFACLLVITVSSFLYFGPMRRRMSKREKPQPETTPCPDTGLTLTYEEPHVDKYIMGPPIIHDYRALPPWDTFARNNGMDMYRKFNAGTKTRPHIVYV